MQFSNHQLSKPSKPRAQAIQSWGCQALFRTGPCICASLWCGSVGFACGDQTPENGLPLGDPWATTSQGAPYTWDTPGRAHPSELLTTWPPHGRPIPRGPHTPAPAPPRRPHPMGTPTPGPPLGDQSLGAPYPWATPWATKSEGTPTPGPPLGDQILRNSLPLGHPWATTAQGTPDPWVTPGRTLAREFSTLPDTPCATKS